MNRRAFLVTVGSMAVAGCTTSQSSTDTTKTATASQTTTPTSTRTQTPVPQPTITDASLLTHYDDFGDVQKNPVDAVGLGGFANVGFEYELPIHDGKSKEHIQVTIYNDGSSVTTKNDSSENLTDKTNHSKWQRSMPFDTTNWGQGTYVAEIFVRDEVSGENSQKEEVEFNVNEPLGKGEANIRSVSSPDSVSVGEEFIAKFNLANTTGRDGSIISSMSGRYNNSEWQSVSDSKFKFNIAANSTRLFEGSPISFDREGTYSYRLDAIGETWSVEVTE